MCALTQLLFTALSIYIWAVIANIVAGWLILFDVINPRHPVVYRVLSFLSRAVDPLLDPIRRVTPRIGMLDLSPLALIVGIYLLQWALAGFFAPTFCR